MSEDLDPGLDALARLRGAAAVARARDLLALERPWADWLAALNRLHVASPETELAAATALRKAAQKDRRKTFVAQLCLIEARALHRVGSPADAARAFQDAARRLDGIDDPKQATKARILRVDALAHAGRVEEAIDSARALEAEVAGRPDAMWRDVLRINAANALRLGGRVDDAIAGYDKAARGFARRGDRHTAAIARVNAGVALMDVGNAARARERFGDAAAWFAEAGQPDLEQDARHNEAWARVRCGELGPGIHGLNETAERLSARGLERRAAVCRMDMAEALTQAGDHEGAESLAVEAADAFRASDAHAEHVEALLLAARAAARRGGGRADPHLRAAGKGARRHGRPALGLRVDLLLQDAAFAAGELPEPRVLARIVEHARRLGQASLAAECGLLRAHRSLRTGRVADARRFLGAPELRRPGRPWLRAAAETARAQCDARQGDRAAALRRLRRVGSFLDDVRTGLPGAWLRTTFVLGQLDPFLTRVDLLLERGRPADLREAAAVLDALAARRFLEGPLSRRHAVDAALRDRLESIYDQIARGDGPTRGVDPARLAVLETQARGLERQLAARRRESERTRTSSTVAADVRVSHAPPVELAQNQAAVYLWRRGDRARALLCTGTVPGRSVEIGSPAAMQAHLDRLRFHAARAHHFGGDAASDALEQELSALSKLVLAPLDPATWPRKVFFVLDPELPDLPLEFLPVAGMPLCAYREVVRAPSVGARARRRRARHRRLVLTLGEADLPHTLREAAAVAAGGACLEGEAADRRALSAGLETYRVVHIAGHGFDAPDAPFLGGIRLADGWYAAADVPSRIASELVVLSACRTGSGRGVAGLAWGGLPEALLRAGARRVIWTTDDVDDSTTADFMTRFHGALGMASVERAFGAAVAATWLEAGHPGALLPLRLSGVRA